jgi:hypothetical protein
MSNVTKSQNILRSISRFLRRHGLIIVSVFQIVLIPISVIFTVANHDQRIALRAIVFGTDWARIPIERLGCDIRTLMDDGEAARSRALLLSEHATSLRLTNAERSAATTRFSRADHETANTKFGIAASCGNAVANIRLAVSHMRGYAVQRDCVEARRLANLGASEAATEFADFLRLHERECAR